jgi:Abortive infection alpha
MNEADSHHDATQAPHPHQNGSGPIDALPGIARIGVSAWWHGTEWAIKTGVKTGLRVAEVTGSPSKAADLVRDARGTARHLLGDLLRLAGLEEELSSAAGVAKKVSDAVPLAPRERDASAQNDYSRNGSSNGVPRSLQQEGEELLRRSRDVNYEFDAHPAYERILSELAPDEARILRLLLIEGPQPSVDIRTGGPLGMMRSRLIAPGLSMIGARAGCRYVERVPSYLNNLFRLGLVWFSRETLNDPMKYQVLEAQPDVLEAIHSVQHAKVVRRSVHLTPFGEDFCRTCLTPEVSSTAEFPEHSTPPQDVSNPQPPAVDES